MNTNTQDTAWDTMHRLGVTEIDPEDYDWREAFKYAARPMLCEGASCSPDPIELTEVRRVFHMREGENDGPSWLAIGRVADGRYFYLIAGCDYTGWDCQAGGQCWVSHDLDNLLQFGIDDDARTVFGL